MGKVIICAPTFLCCTKIMSSKNVTHSSHKQDEALMAVGTQEPGNVD